jgi:hypothetical protein
VLLSPPTGIADPDATASLQPSGAVLLGGPAALSDAVAGDLRRAPYDAGGPHPSGYDPLPASEIHDLTVFSVAFDRGLDIGPSDIYVSMNGEEVPGYLTAGEPDTLQFHPTQMPLAPAPDQPIDVRVIVAAFDGSAWRHLDYHLTYRKVAFGIGASGLPVSAYGLIWPVDGTVISEFGMRSGAMHQGMDIFAESGVPIHAAKAGTVIFSGTMSGYGYVEIVDHGGGFTTLYGHQSVLGAQVGQEVAQDEVIGYVGDTGNATTTHLHFETRVDDVPQNPRNYLP